jgi:hypothetical protein
MSKPLSGFWRSVLEVDMFFQGKDPVHKALRAIIKRFDKAGIAYAVVGGMALKAHNFRRMTDDLDLLVTPEGLEEFRRRYVPRYYEETPQRRRRLTDKANKVTIDFLVTGRFPGTGEPGPIAFPDPSAVSELRDEARVVDLATLVQLKLAARRYQDFADVVALIRANALDESFAERLHPTVRQDYVECLEEMRREDEYEERNGGHGGDV